MIFNSFQKYLHMLHIAAYLFHSFVTIGHSLCDIMKLSYHERSQRTKVLPHESLVRASDKMKLFKLVPTMCFC